LIKLAFAEIQRYSIRFVNVRFWKKTSLYALKTLVFVKKPSLYALKTLNFKLTLPSLGVGDLWHFGADQYLWLKDPDPNPDPTPFFSDFKDAKNVFFAYFFTTYPQAHYLQSQNLFFCEYWNFILQALFQSVLHVHLCEKREGSGSIPLTNGSGYGRPKIIRIPNTELQKTKVNYF
jgi:hypothetical protein